MANSPLSVALVGYGLAGSTFHAPLIAATDGLRMAVIVTSNSERAHEARVRYPDVSIIDSIDNLWELTPDAVVIATPNTLHAPMAHQAIDHAVPCVVDKPFALSADQGIGVVQHAEQADVLVTVYQNRRWDGDYLTIAKLISDGALGRVARFESRFEKWRPTIRPGWHDRASVAEGGGMLFDLGSHVIDQAIHLFGPVATVYAEVDTTRRDGQSDDDVFVALTHGNGVRSHLFMNSAAADLGVRFRILGTKGAFTKYGMDPQEAALRAGETPGARWGLDAESSWGVLNTGDTATPIPTVAGSYPGFYSEFEAALRGLGPVPVDPTDAVRTLGIIEAARESSATRRVIEI